MHEFTHAAVFELAGWDVPRWLNEGLADFVCGDVPASSHPDARKAASEHSGILKAARLSSDLGDMNKRKDNPELVDAAYMLAGSLVAFWVEHYGLASVRAALEAIGKGVSPEAAFYDSTGVSLARIERDWRNSLRGVD